MKFCNGIANLMLAALAAVMTLQPQPLPAVAPDADLASIERRVQRVHQTVSPAVVKITAELDDTVGWSGVIATEDGYVVTCAHHAEVPGERVFVHLADGRSVPARVHGLHESMDIALFKISVAGPWPHVPFGKSTDLKPGDSCVAIGYPDIDAPASNRTPTVRMGRIVHADAAPWMILSSCRVKQGDSGGGLFDLGGRLAGVCSGSGAITRASTRHAGIELFQRHWDDLVEARSLASPTEEEVDRGLATVIPLLSQIELAPKLGLGAIESTLHGSLERLPSVAVEVLCDGEQKVLGTIVGAEGWILTKSSELFGDVSVRLADGRELPARVRGSLHEHDLALLKVSGTGLPQIHWSDRGTPLPGTLVAAMGCGQTPGAVGIVAHPSRTVPPERGTMIGSIQLQSTDPAPRVWKVGGSDKFFGTPFHKGDIVTAVDGVPTPDFKSLIRLNGGPDDGRFPGKIVGDRMRAVVERDGQKVQLHFQLAGLASPLAADFYPSGRFTGFPCVYSTDIFVLPEMCGGPVMDHSGHVVGISIATANNEVETYVIPAKVARQATQRLIERAQSMAPPGVAHLDASPTIRPARVGDAAPEFEVETLNGTTFRLADQRGKLVVLCFWMMHSELCTLELPNLRALHQDLIRDASECTMISLYTDAEKWEPDFQQHTQKHGIDWPVAWIRSHSTVSADYLTRHLQPCLVLVGRSGEVLLRDHDVARFHTALNQIVAAKTSAD